MDYLIDLFQNNPIVVLIISAITLLSAIMTIVSHWKPFWRDVLLKKVTIPVYSYLIIFILIVLPIILLSTIEVRPKELRTIEGKSFGVQRIIVDGKRFVNCTFRKTELVFRGESGSSLENCKYIQPTFTFGGPAATTVKIMKAMYEIPQFRLLIDNTFKAIREGDLPIAVPPSNAADN